MTAPSNRTLVSQDGRWSWSAEVQVATSMFGQPGEPWIWMTWRTFRSFSKKGAKKKAARFVRSLDRVAVAR